VYGLDRGFDLYDDGTGVPERRADVVADAALAWLAQDPDRPFFAWVHFFDPHGPYQPPPEYAHRGADAYDGEIGGRWSSSPEITGKGWVITGRTTTACSCTTRPSASRSSCPGPGSSREAS
jgi:hypothetical protein